MTIHELNRKQRLGRALAGLGKWWGVALASVFIPIAHFVLVPAFLIIGVWQFFRKSATAELATNARGTCPDCRREQQFDLASRWRVPQSVTCQHCQRSLQLSLL